MKVQWNKLSLKFCERILLSKDVKEIQMTCLVDRLVVLKVVNILKSNKIKDKCVYTCKIFVEKVKDSHNLVYRKVVAKYLMSARLRSIFSFSTRHER